MNINIVIPLAGGGSRFQEAGFSYPKPLIPVNNDSPMIEMVTKNLAPSSFVKHGINDFNYRFVYICQKEHCEKYDLENILARIYDGNCEVIQIDGLTEGAACTVLSASEHINNNDGLIIANSDQLIEQGCMDRWNTRISGSSRDGLIMTFKATHPKWSYARIDDNGSVKEVAEKKIISEYATTGLYWFKHGSDFVGAATSMIAKDIRHNEEFYVCPVFNELILNGKDIGHFEIPADKFYGLGDPESLKKFQDANKV